ncbi:putative phage-associated protein [Dyadobacter sp. BE34]|uniref:Phage-associated protein n=1 Tax=Dyadobacter fermentans TaxID=94254 RepID=A0ABU1QVM9_9BACT|nr:MULTISPECIES: type II toxin-antitoxin system antitoxin SocA domain-containing protein [Dyadobacter]MDR6804355.1 putative phage-associated protein [Dyadobacter fermentans]MDR7042095.1 putative phage-associated protein [Dyadobacter sp. BE242]MDR7196498.1 putative phage-associated protein [Dyadobacter sp. BE34]MDR7212957.1 putative phage-associated protein [Dyadobacter sp. BE31]MDR7261904.1 putative phage-associated protein [Dyadobacter sp. BE32]
MKSPITGKEMQVRNEVTSLAFRKEEFEVVTHYYECEDSGERFSDDRLDELSIVQVHNQYREKYGIPFPEEIRRIREGYGISASKMSEILGLGANSYRLYESGEVPSVAIGRLIMSIRNPATFVQQVTASVHFLTDKEIKKLTLAAENRNMEFVAEKVFPSRLNGYRQPDFAKIAGMITFFQVLWKITLFKTKLNKLLFYADFNAYRLTGYSITGLEYRAIQFGPVPAQFQKMYVDLSQRGQISIEEQYFGNGAYGDEIKACTSFDKALFSDTELKVLEFVAQQYGKLATDDIVNLSHEETGWYENSEQKSLINYRYAFELNQGISYNS